MLRRPRFIPNTALYIYGTCDASYHHIHCVRWWSASLFDYDDGANSCLTAYTRPYTLRPAVHPFFPSFCLNALTLAARVCALLFLWLRRFRRAARATTLCHISTDNRTFYSKTYFALDVALHTHIRFDTRVVVDGS